MKTTELSVLLNPKEAFCMHSIEIKHFLTDSRSFITAEQTAFVAIQTNSGDGHHYIEQMYRLGVRCFIVEIPIRSLREMYPEASFLYVHSSIEALQIIAHSYRSRLQQPILGITGSNGKTIVKEYLNTLLAPHIQISRSPASYNSQIGVPLSVLGLKEDMDLGIIEAGISDPNTMQQLAKVIQPNIGILTNLGTAHIEHFTSQEELIDEKLKLFSNCPTLITSLDDSQIREAIRRTGNTSELKGWSKQEKTALIYVNKIKKGKNKSLLEVQYNGQNHSVEIPFIDDANISNILICLSFIASTYPELWETCLDSVPNLEGIEMRLELKDSFHGNILINDAYSCDLDALRIALDFQRRRCSHSNMPAVLILSDIIQTGLSGEELYTCVAQLIQSFKIKKLFAVGDSIGAYQHLFNFLDSSFYSSTQELILSPKLKEIKESCILIKGARRFAFEELIRSLSLMEHQTTLEINLSALRHNLNYYKSILSPQHKISCMIKADGYGLGAVEIARLLEDSKVDYLAVALNDEGKNLRLEGIKSPIIVMNPELSSTTSLFKYQLEPEVYSLKLLKAIIKEAEQHQVEDYPIHIKIDTGMHRLGFEQHDLAELCRLVKSSKSLKIASVFSHLAGADDEALDPFTHKQAQKLQDAHSFIKQEMSYSPLLHLLNTAGIERHREQYSFDMVRLGLGLYGISPTHYRYPELRKVARLSTTILQTKTVQKGAYIGYSCKAKVNQDTRIAILPIGYADGFSRQLGNGAYHVLIRGKLCPTIGNVCMDTCMIDISTIPEVQAGDRAIIFGEEQVDIEDLAKIEETIPYEILTSLSPRIQKIYLQE